MNYWHRFQKKRLFLHCCCAPCSSYVLEYLHDFFDITVFFYNPNISEACEYQKRKRGVKAFLQTAPFGKEIHMHDADYEPELFEKMAKGHENDRSRGKMRKVFQTSVGGNRKNTQKRVRMIIFVRHFPSALIKMRIY